MFMESIVRCWLVAKRRNFLPIASKSDTAFFKNRRHNLPYKMIYNHSNNIKIKVLLGPSSLCMMDGGDVLKIWFFVISYFTNILWQLKFMAARIKHLAWTSWNWWPGNAYLSDSKIRTKLKIVRHRLSDFLTLSYLS